LSTFSFFIVDYPNDNIKIIPAANNFACIGDTHLIIRSVITLLYSKKELCVLSGESGTGAGVGKKNDKKGIIRKRWLGKPLNSGKENPVSDTGKY
jgi:hypothetical protein